jgi:hypothetical protein
VTNGWSTVSVVSDILSAQAICELLVSESVPARIASDTELLGAARQCRIQVPEELLSRAKWVLSDAHFTDAELEFLATGKIDRGGDDQ